MSATSLRRPIDADVEALVSAGAIVPGDEATGDNTDVISARQYRHPALDHPVVRLIPAGLSQSEDNSMGYFGFDKPHRRTEVGVGRRRSLGFPGWALVNDPANGHHALALVKDMDRMARQARTKPGAAKKGFLELGAILEGSAPQFLPTFFEEAGRAFLDADNIAHAAMMLVKARDAEKAHGLDVDLGRMKEVFLEFDFAGALPAKALSSHAKWMATRHSADEAYEAFRTLCLERVAGGLPPYAGMAEDLRRLAKAAKRDVATEDKAVLAELIRIPVTRRAPVTFWKSYRKSLVSLARREPWVRGRLLAFVPEPGGEPTGADELWLGILAESGAAEALTMPPGTTAAEAEAPGGPAGWLERMTTHRATNLRSGERFLAFLDLVDAMAPRLRADAKPVNLFSHRVDLDLLDVCVAADVPLADPPENLSLNVGEWLEDDRPGRRELTAVGADPRFGPALGKGATTGVYKPKDVRPALKIAGLRIALGHWLDEQAEQFGKSGLRGIWTSLFKLDHLNSPEALAVNPDAVRRIAATDITAVLARTLRGGLFDELGWPAWEEALDLLHLDEQDPGGRWRSFAVIGEGWPALVLSFDDKSVVAGPDGILLDHTVRVPAELWAEYHPREYINERALFTDGQLLELWQQPHEERAERDPRAYWSGNPGAVFDLGEEHNTNDIQSPHASIPLPGGGRFTGGRALQAGDTAIARPTATHSDGTTYWSVRDASGSRWREVDPVTGEVGGESLPVFLESFATDAAHLALESCFLRPAAPGTEHSPLGCVDGMLGFRVRREPDGSWLGESIDGHIVRRPRGTPPPRGVLRLPGQDRPHTISVAGKDIALFDPDGHEITVLDSTRTWKHQIMARGTHHVPPLDWWHCLRVRDEAGSMALRTIDDWTVTALLAVATAERLAEEKRHAEKFSEKVPSQATVDELEAELVRIFGDDRPADLAAAVGRLLPEITHPLLLKGVSGVLWVAGRLRYKMGEYRELAGDAAKLAGQTRIESPFPVRDDTIARALGWSGAPRPYDGYDGKDSANPHALLDLIDTLGGLAKTAAGGGTISKSELPATGVHNWLDIVPALGVLAWQAASPVTSDEHRDALVALLRGLAGNGVGAAAGHWRVVEVRVRMESEFSVLDWRPLCEPTRNGFVALLDYRYGRGKFVLFDGLQYTTEQGKFAQPTMGALKQVSTCDSWVDGAWVEEFCRTLADEGPPPLRTEAVEQVASRTGLSRAESTLVLAGFPNVHAPYWESTSLDAATRRVLGLKAGETNTALKSLADIKPEVTHELLQAALPHEPRVLWTQGPNLDGLVDEWISRVGRRGSAAGELPE